MEKQIPTFTDFCNGYCNISFNRDLYAYVYDKTLSNDDKWWTTKMGRALPEILQITKDKGKRFLVLVKTEYEYDTAKSIFPSVIIYDMLKGTNETFSATTLLALKDRDDAIQAPNKPPI